MKLPQSYIDNKEWTLVGPLGPNLPTFLAQLPVVGVDGGAHFAPKLDLWVGDDDSTTEKINCAYAFNHPSQKDDSDLALALSLLGQGNARKLHLWGFSGGRLDHELFNLGECLHFLENCQEGQIYIYDDSGKIKFHLVSAGEWRIIHHGIFSIGTLKETFIELTGSCEYQMKPARNLVPLSSLGLSNKAQGEIILKTPGPAFFYFPRTT
jgi:thiamine pyrophosphokinase